MNDDERLAGLARAYAAACLAHTSAVVEWSLMPLQTWDPDQGYMEARDKCRRAERAEFDAREALLEACR